MEDSVFESLIKQFNIGKLRKVKAFERRYM